MKISICMCTYNGEKYLKEQLESIIKQTKLPDEIVIFDDCSTDNTLIIILDYKKIYNNISWIIQKNMKNKGWKCNFKDAINNTSGDYIFLCDQDDIWEQTKIEKMIKVMDEKPHIDLLVSGFKIKNENKSYKKFKLNKPLISIYNIKKIKSRKYLLYTAYPGCTYCFKKEMKTMFNMCWKPEFPHDFILWKIAYLRQTLYLYEKSKTIWRRHEESATAKAKKILSKQNIKIHYDELNLNILFFDYLEKVFPGRFNQKVIKKTQKMLSIRKLLYDEKNIKYFLKLIKYRNYYLSEKSFIFDFLIVLKIGKV